MTVTGPDQHRTAHIEVFGALDADALALVIRLAHSTIRSGCVEVLLQLQALTDFPTRLFAELHQLDQFPPAPLRSAATRLGRGHRGRCAHQPPSREPRPDPASTLGGPPLDER
jgi:hypothetical protein